MSRDTVQKRFFCQTVSLEVDFLVDCEKVEVAQNLVEILLPCPTAKVTPFLFRYLYQLFRILRGWIRQGDYEDEDNKYNKDGDDEDEDDKVGHNNQSEYVIQQTR